jgi:hypothetical protein
VTWQFLSVLPVWVLTAAAAVVIGLTSVPEQRLTWVGITFAGVVVASFIIQLAIQKKEGFVVRTMASIGVSLVILAITTGVFALI